MSNMVINVIHKPISLASQRTRLHGEWHCRKRAGTHPSGVELGVEAVSWGMTEPETLEGLFLLENVQKTWSPPSPRQPEKANRVLAGPQVGAQLCPARPPHLPGGEREAGHFSLPTPAGPAFPRMSLRGC